MTEATVLVVEHEDKCPPALVGRLAGRGRLRPGGLPSLRRRRRAGARRRTTASWCSAARWVPTTTRSTAGSAPVKERVRDAVATGLPTLGICLGHQLIAVALGGTVGRNPSGQQLGLLEVGWSQDAARPTPLFGPLATPRRGVHWNDDVVTRLPDRRAGRRGGAGGRDAGRPATRRPCGACSCTPRSTSRCSVRGPSPTAARTRRGGSTRTRCSVTSPGPGPSSTTPGGRSRPASRRSCGRTLGAPRMSPARP